MLLGVVLSTAGCYSTKRDGTGHRINRDQTLRQIRLTFGAGAVALTTSIGVPDDGGAARGAGGFFSSRFLFSRGTNVPSRLATTSDLLLANAILIGLS